MKLGKFILPALLAVGAISGFALAKVNENRNLKQASAMSTYLLDEDMDVGINVTASATAAADWTVAQFYLNCFESNNASTGDYLAFRMRSNNNGASYFDFIPNGGGNPYRVDLGPAEGIKCVPAVPGGEAFDYGGARNFDLPMNFWAGADVWFCIPKTAFTRDYWATGNPCNWSDLWAVYFMFYGTTNDYVDFDIGNLWTANIDGDGHLVKINRLINWANVPGDQIPVTDSGNMSKLTITRNNSNLVPAVKFVQEIEHVDACNVAASTTAYNNLKDSYDALTNAQKFYVDEYVLYDYADGDTSHAGARATAYYASDKWAQIIETATSASGSRIIMARKDQNIILISVLTVTMIGLSAAGLFFIIRRRKVQK